MRITAGEVALAASGRLSGPDVEAGSISFDSRTLTVGEAFVAIRGDRDGHDHLHSAVANGAGFVIVESGRAIDSVTCVEVEDTLVALGRVGAACRERLDVQLEGRVVGITGSAGKTSTKNLVHAVLSGGFAPVQSPRASLNNDIGVPVTIINSPDSVRALVLEMAMRGFGEIERLCALARPRVAVVTNVGDAHAARVGGIDGVARAKGELVESLPEDGVAVLNADDERVRAMSSRTWADVMTYGSRVGADVRWTPLEVGPTGLVRTVFEHDGERAEATPALPGEHMAANAAAAVAVGLAVGMSLEAAVSGIGREVVESGRMRWREGIDGARVLDDTYNANTTSMIAGLRVLADVDAARRFAVLGRMHELDDPERAHREIARLALDMGIEVLAVDTDLYGVDPIGVDEVVDAIAPREGDVVLVKGSRAAAMERVVSGLTNPR